jgi:hypothetical protein
MDVNGLIAWIATIGVGLAMLSIYLGHGGLRQFRAGRRRLRPQLVLSHTALGFAGIGVWVAFLITDDELLAWIAFGLLVAVTVVGTVSYYVWQRRRLGAVKATSSSWDLPAGALASARLPAEQHFPVGVVLVHGVFAVGTIVLVAAAAMSAADSDDARTRVAGAAQSYQAAGDSPGAAVERPERAREVRAARRRGRVVIGFRSGTRRTELRLLAGRRPSSALRRVVIATRPLDEGRVALPAGRRVRYVTVTALDGSGRRSLAVRAPVR